MLYDSIPRLLGPPDNESLLQRAEELQKAGVPSRLASRIASLSTMFATSDIVEVAGESGLDVESVAGVHFRIGSHLELHWLLARIAALPRDDRWSALARAALREDLYGLHRMLTAEVLRVGPPDMDADERVTVWVAANPAAERCMQTLADIRVRGMFDLTTLPVAVREVRNLLQLRRRCRPGPRRHRGWSTAMTLGSSDPIDQMLRARGLTSNLGDEAGAACTARWVLLLLPRAASEKEAAGSFDHGEYRQSKRGPGASRGDPLACRPVGSRQAGPDGAVQAPAAGDERRIEVLEERVDQLEALLEGLQDAVHRESIREGGRIGALEKRTEPSEISRALNRDARERGL